MIFTAEERTRLQEARSLWELKFTKNLTQVTRRQAKAAAKFKQLTRRTAVVAQMITSPKEVAAFKAIKNAFYSEQNLDDLPDIGAEPGWRERGEFSSGWLREEDLLTNVHYWMKAAGQPPSDVVVSKVLVKMVKKKVLERRFHEAPELSVDDEEYRTPGTYYRMLEK